ncbi:unnamed protein product [Lampetra planeri]
MGNEGQWVADNTEYTWGELIRRLDQRFGARNEEEAKAALNACYHQPGEDLRNYAEDVHLLTQSSRLGYAADIIEDLAAKKVHR